jgi:enoyl-CoA hydratase/crotonobetainyl-CoA hydratase
MTHRVLFSVADGVATVTLNRPEARNAVDRAMAGEIAAALDEVDARDDVRAAVLTGAGPVFCAGMDLKAFAATGERPVVSGRGAFGIAARPPEKPLVAAVEGKALGGGFEVALACDLIVAGPDAVFGLPEVRRGLVAAAGGVVRLPRRVPRALALELVLTGEPIDAPTACRWGLVNRVTEPGAALRVATELATLIAANAPLAVRTAKFLLTAAADWPADEAFGRQEPHVDAVRRSADAREGALAFAERRSPRWTGE